MSAERLFRIINILMNKQNVSAVTLAQEFEVSTRTIYRDIDKLTLAGVPVYTTQGRDGGISLLPNYVLNGTLLTNQEQEQILMGLKNITGIYKGTDELLVKLGALFRREQADWIEVDLKSWQNSQKENTLFEGIKEAILNKNSITFMYFGGNQTKSLRRVKPIKLVFKARAWYLQAFCMTRNAYRTFKVSRIKELENTNEVFNEVLKAPTITIDTTKIGDLCILEFDKKIANRVYEEFDEEDIVEKKDCLLVTTNMPHDSWLLGYLLSFGNYCKVIEPKSLQTIIKQEIEKMQRIYNT